MRPAARILPCQHIAKSVTLYLLNDKFRIGYLMVLTRTLSFIIPKRRAFKFFVSMNDVYRSTPITLDMVRLRYMHINLVKNKKTLPSVSFSRSSSASVQRREGDSWPKWATALAKTTRASETPPAPIHSRRASLIQRGAMQILVLRDKKRPEAAYCFRDE